jgi:hypothetical protein
MKRWVSGACRHSQQLGGQDLPQPQAPAVCSSPRIRTEIDGRMRESWDRLGEYRPQGKVYWNGTRRAGRPRAIPAPKQTHGRGGRRGRAAR